MAEESVSRPNLSIGDHIRKAYNGEDRLLRSDFHIESEEDLDHLREIGVQYAFVTNRDTEVDTRTESNTSPEETAEEIDVPGPYNECREVYEDLKDEVSEQFERLRETSPTKDSLENLQEPLEQMLTHSKQNEVSMRILHSLETSSPETFSHSVNLSLLAALFGSEKGYDEGEVMDLCIGALLHDLGKTTIPEEILNKRGELTAGERKILESHPQKGHNLLEGTKFDDLVKRIVLEHHERPDGSGYPNGREDLHPYSVVVSVLEVYESLTSPQIYREPCGPLEAYKELYEEFGDIPETREVLEDLIAILGIYPVGTYVELTNKDIAVVTDTNRDDPKNPVVKIVGAADVTIDDPFEVNLSQLGRASFLRNEKIYSNDLQVKRIIDVGNGTDLKNRIPGYLQDQMPSSIQVS